MEIPQKIATKSREADPNGIRIRGIPDSSGQKHERLDEDVAQVRKLFDFLGVKGQIMDARRLDSFNENKARDVLVSVGSFCEKN